MKMTNFPMTEIIATAVCLGGVTLIAIMRKKIMHTIASFFEKEFKEVVKNNDSINLSIVMKRRQVIKLLNSQYKLLANKLSDKFMKLYDEANQDIDKQRGAFFQKQAVKVALKDAKETYIERMLDNHFGTKGSNLWNTTINKLVNDILFEFEEISNALFGDSTRKPENIQAFLIDEIEANITEKRALIDQICCSIFKTDKPDTSHVLEVMGSL